MRCSCPRWLLAITIAVCFPAGAAAQQASVGGIVTSSSTGGPLEGASVALIVSGEERYGTVTDRNGFYQIGGIDPGAYTLRSRRIGHGGNEQAVTFAPGGRLTVNFQLEAAAVELEGVVVSSGAGPTIRDLGRQRVTPAEVRRVPVPAGSGDLASYLQTLPGVTTTGDRGGQLFVRGGTSAENMVLIDGIPVYQPFHILGFFSVFPEDLVSSADFYAGGFGARYSGRTSSVLDVGLRDGDANRYRAVVSASPFLAEALVEGPGGEGVTWIGSLRRSVVEETSGTLLGARQPITFDSQLFKVSALAGDNLRCSALALRTADRGSLDAEQQSYVSWSNVVLGGRCVTQFERVLRLLELNFSSSAVDNAAVSDGTSRFFSRIWRMQHEAHSTSMIGSVPVYAGYHLYNELTDYDITELFGLQRRKAGILGAGGYLEAAVPLGPTLEVRPGAVVTLSPRLGIEPRVRASWEPFGRSSERVQGALGLYRQHVVGASDIRDVSSVFTAWMGAPQGIPSEALHATLGWQQVISGGLSWSLEGYYKQLNEVPVPVWRAVALFTPRLGRVDGEVYGADARVEYSTERFYGFVGYGYGWTEYISRSDVYSSWFGNPVQKYHPPHDRRHQVNALTSVDVAGYTASLRWQLGTGLPFSKPLGFDEAFDPTQDYYDVTTQPGTPRIVLGRPFNSRLPSTHRLDVALRREFDLRSGTLTAQAGAINAYDRRNMFYYDLFSGRRVDQLPLAPYASLTFRTR